MTYNFIGPIAAIATFLGIWAGHVLVREIEKHSASILPPTFGFAILGIGLLVGTFFTSALTLSAPMGILGMTALWDAYEFFRQEKRIIKGHAPANPNNPRHKKILHGVWNRSRYHFIFPSKQLGMCIDWSHRWLIYLGFNRI